MAAIDLYSKPFDEETITKLEIFENYAQEWLPTFIMSGPKELHIFDFFADKTPVAVGCFGFLIALPTFALYILPFYLEYYILKEIFDRFYDQTIGKISFYFSIYINLILIFYYVKVSINNYQDIKAQGH